MVSFGGETLVASQDQYNVIMKLVSENSFFFLSSTSPETG